MWGGAEICPGKGFIDIVDHKNLYLGEVHGTENAPQIARCFLNRAIERNEKVVVSLELPPIAADAGSYFWEGRDGRASKAMRGLLVYVLALQREGAVSVHYQYEKKGQLDERLGDELNGLARNARVVALSGNFHARRAASSAGGQVDGSFVNVMLAAVGGGRAWFCKAGSADDCKEYEMPVSKSGRAVGDWVDGGDYGYDYIYFHDKYVPSMPLVFAGGGSF